ncbi:MAG: hypothetical protein IKL95_00600 [Alphaproteobacteria bacterium]|nr:hypothetical protein [Alphaproteobacteria bacterium]
MNWLKKFWIVFTSFLPFSAGAFSPFLIGGIAFGGGIIGMSIWRNVSPVNMSDALSFFSSCWSCQIFSDVLATMSNIIPATYKSLGRDNTFCNYIDGGMVRLANFYCICHTQKG